MQPLRSRRHAVTLLLLLAAPAACVSGPLGSGCLPAPSRAEWSTTARDGRVQGQVRDLDDGTPIGNVEVALDSGATSQRTDSLGIFAFDGVREGRHVVTTRAAGYVAHGDTLMVPGHGGLEGALSLALRQDILKRCALPLTPITR